ncbi:MAG: alpha-2-macroglobulin family protein, partial [Candidatus Thermoplasmatota archaeon]|nr:alpha-2-macroglobulin family protein [Candidatus Thermoplasmatota archaeon]
FPETWYWQPMLILDNRGEANISLTAPDSITSWEIQAVASTTDGKVGLGNHNITVFQEFFIEPDLPYSLLRNDTVTMPVTIYNYGEDRSVTVSIENGPWFETLSSTTMHTNVLADTVTAVNFTIRATEVGKHRLNVTASAGMAGDAITKEVRVRSDGLMNMTVENGVLVNTTSFSKTIQPDPARIAGSEELYVKLQAGITAITVDGADQFIQHVYGCGEQSLSTLSIDILAFRHIKDSTLSSSRLSEFEDIVKKGIQHELQYVAQANNGQGRGIVWFPGDQDVHPWLTAWGLITFQDALEAGFYVDPAVISDMQTWLISQQRTDGSWAFPNWGLYETANQALLEKEAGATAYIVRALLHAGMSPSDAPIAAAMSYLASKAGSYTDDPYTVAIMLLALEMGQGSPAARTNLLNSLIGHAIWDGDGVRWEGETSLTSYDRYWGPANAHTIETTAYAVLALQERGGHSAHIAGGIRYMLDSRLGMGGFYSTQDTVVAFQAISKAGNVEMENVDINILANGIIVSTRSFDNDTLELTHYVDIPVSNPVEITIETMGIGQVIYQIIYTEYLPWTPPTYTGLEMELVFSDTTISVGETVEVSATLSYNGTHELIQMVLVRLVAPTGFSFLNNDFDILQQKGTISYYDGWGSDRNLYIQPVRKGETITFTYHLSNRVPVQTIAEGSFAFDMYNPDLSSHAAPQAISAS